MDLTLCPPTIGPLRGRGQDDLLHPARPAWCFTVSCLCHCSKGSSDPGSILLGKKSSRPFVSSQARALPSRGEHPNAYRPQSISDSNGHPFLNREVLLGAELVPLCIILRSDITSFTSYPFSWTGAMIAWTRPFLEGSRPERGRCIFVF